MSGLIQDVRLAIRGFKKAPVFTSVAILTLTLAIGANTAIFSVLNALVLRDLPVREPSTLIQFTRITAATQEGAFSLPMFRAIAEQQRTSSALMGWLGNSVITVEIDDQRTKGMVTAVTGNYFSELGVRPIVGRLLTEADDQLESSGSAPVAVIGHGFWRRHFNADTAAIGRTLRVHGRPFTIIGVTSPEFKGLGLALEIDVAVPLAFAPIVRDVPLETFQRGRNNPIYITGRLRPNATIEEARAELATLWPGILAVTIPPGYVGAQRDAFLQTRIGVLEGAKGFEPNLRRQFTQPLTIVLAITLLVVLIACVNLASLMMSRVSARMHEMGVRLALGSGRWRMAQQLLVEGILLSLAGAFFGVLVAVWTSEALVAVMLRTYLVPPSFDVQPDSRVMMFTIALATLVGTLFSIAPAVRVAYGSSVEALRRSTRTATGSSRTGRMLVAVQVALSLVLLTNAGLLVRSLQQIHAVDSGLRTDDVFVVYPGPRPGGYHGVDHESYYQEVLQRLAAVPGVQEAGISLSKPAAGGAPSPDAVTSIGTAPGSTPGISAFRSEISPGFFATLGMHVVAGRDFNWGDHSRGRRVTVVSQSLADQLFAGRPALGQRIRIGVTPDLQDLEVIGIVADARLYNLKDSNLAAAYLPALQAPDPSYKCFVLKGRNVSMAAVTQAVESLGVEQITSPLETLDFIVGRALLQERIVAVMGAFFGTLALLMAGVGIYGLTSYQVSERRREIGIRMALGADPWAVLVRVVREGVTITGLGVLSGSVVAIAVAQLLRTLLFGVSTYDWVTLIMAPVLLVATAVGACVGPAARAARVDPMITLRAE